MEQFILEGNISVKACLQAKKRSITKIVVDKNKKDKDTNYILRLAKNEHIEIEYSTRDQIDQIASGNTHGGLIAYCGPRIYQTLKPLLEQESLFLAIVEGVEDPFNFGYILRTLYAAGCDGIIVGKRNWTSAATTLTRASAGASEYMNIIVSENLEETIQQLQQQNIAFVCANRKDAISLYEYSFPKKVCIAIGGEMRGLSKGVQALSDQNLFIPYRGDFRNAMTAAASTAIFAFELVRQQTEKD